MQQSMNANEAPELHHVTNLVHTMGSTRRGSLTVFQDIHLVVFMTSLSIGLWIYHVMLLDYYLAFLNFLVSFYSLSSERFLIFTHAPFGV